MPYLSRARRDAPPEDTAKVEGTPPTAIALQIFGWIGIAGGCVMVFAAISNQRDPDLLAAFTAVIGGILFLAAARALALLAAIERHIRPAAGPSQPVL